MQSRFFHSLQIYRGIAALMVVFHHLWNNLSYYYHLDFKLINSIAIGGKFGVDFFFVLSGFIICYSNYESANRASEVTTYLKNRIFRIYIPYLPIGILMLVLYMLMSDLSGSARQINVFKSIFLLPVEGNTALSVAWTLVYEMFFYLVFAFWFFSKRFFVVFILIWSVLITWLNLLNNPVHGFIGFIGSYYNLEFILGIIAAVIYKNNISDKKLIALALFISVALLLFFNVDRVLVHLLISVSCAFILLMSLGSFLDRLSNLNILMIIGNASYSIYLIHNPVISLLFKSLLRFKIHFFVFFTVSFVVCVISGIFYSKIFEQFLLKKMKRF